MLLWTPTAFGTSRKYDIVILNVNLNLSIIFGRGGGGGRRWGLKVQHQLRHIPWQVPGFCDDRLSVRPGNEFPPIALLANRLSCFQNASLVIQYGDFHLCHVRVIRQMGSQR